MRNGADTIAQQIGYKLYRRTANHCNSSSGTYYIPYKYTSNTQQFCPSATIISGLTVARG